MSEHSGHELATRCLRKKVAWKLAPESQLFLLLSCLPRLSQLVQKEGGGHIMAITHLKLNFNVVLMERG